MLHAGDFPTEAYCICCIIIILLYKSIFYMYIRMYQHMYSREHGSAVYERRDGGGCLYTMS